MADKGQGVKKYNSDNSINSEWRKIHWGTKAPRGSFISGKDSPNSEEYPDDDIEYYDPNPDDDQWKL